MSSHDSLTMRSSSIKTANTTPIVHEPLKKANSLIASSGTHSLHNAIDEPFIVHPGAISSILHLLTTVKSDLNEHVSSFCLIFHSNSLGSFTLHLLLVGLTFAIPHGQFDQELVALRTQPANHVQCQFHRWLTCHVQVRAQRRDSLSQLVHSVHAGAVGYATHNGAQFARISPFGNLIREPSEQI